MNNILITGAGIVSAIGVGKEETLRSLLEQRSGIRPVHYLKTDHHEFPVGEVQLSNDEMCALLGIDPQAQPTTRTALMGMVALKEALEQSGLTSDMYPSIPLISGTTVGGMDKSEQYYMDFLENDSRNEYIRTHDCGACTEMMADHPLHRLLVGSQRRDHRCRAHPCRSSRLCGGGRHRGHHQVPPQRLCVVDDSRQGPLPPI